MLKRIFVFGLLTIALSSCSAEITTASLYGNTNYTSKAYAYRPYVNYAPRYSNPSNELNLTYSKDVDKYINYFVYKDRYFIERAIERAIYYSPIVLPILKKYNLPPDFMYLPVIESGYNPNAVSSSGAAGIWQLMPQTARDYGLVVNSQVDERFDIIKSTEAAAHYLSNLYNQFGDWNKVLAAYNCGSYCVASVFRNDPRGNFWSMQNAFPAQTQQYVPRFLAVLNIVKNYRRFGFDIKKSYFHYALHIYRSNTQATLQNIAYFYGVNYNFIKSLNPQIRSNIVPAGAYVYIPSNPKPYYQNTSTNDSIKRFITGKFE